MKDEGGRRKDEEEAFLFILPPSSFILREVAVVNVLMMTNTYLPQVGGVARSVASFTEAFRRQQHRVVVVAPTYADLPDGEVDVYRVPAIPNFNGSEFSLRLPVP